MIWPARLTGLFLDGIILDLRVPLRFFAKAEKLSLYDRGNTTL